MNYHIHKVTELHEAGINDYEQNGKLYKVLVARLEEGDLRGEELLVIGVISLGNLVFYSTAKAIAVTLVNRFGWSWEDANAVENAAMAALGFEPE